MKLFKFIKYILLLLLTLLIGVQIIYAKTALVLPQSQVSFSIEQNRNFNSLEKEVQPNIGFLKEKNRFVVSEGVSSENQYDFSGSKWCYLAKGVDDLVDAVYNTQKGIISKYKGSISNASRNAKGVFGEVATDVKFTENGFEALHVRKGQNGDLLDGWGETGLDHVFKKNGKYYIVDSKYGIAKLNKNTIDGPQMGDAWIGGSNRLSNAVGIDLAEDILDSDYIRIVSNISDDGSLVLKELDEFGEVIGDFSF